MGTWYQCESPLVWNSGWIWCLITETVCVHQSLHLRETSQSLLSNCQQYPVSVFPSSTLLTVWIYQGDALRLSFKHPSLPHNATFPAHAMSDYVLGHLYCNHSPPLATRGLFLNRSLRLFSMDKILLVLMQFSVIREVISFTVPPSGSLVATIFGTVASALQCGPPLLYHLTHSLHKFTHCFHKAPVSFHILAKVLFPEFRQYVPKKIAAGPHWSHILSLHYNLSWIGLGAGAKKEKSACNKLS